MRMRHIAAGLMLAVSTAPAGAKDDPLPSPLIDALEKCLAISADPQRLACTDAAARRLIDASRRKEVVVVDRDEMKRTRKSLFGFALPRIGLFGKGGPDSGDEVDRVEARITRVAALGYGKLGFTLEDGARWNTTEGWDSPVQPRSGDTLIIKRGAIGNFMVSIKGGRAVRAMRVG